MPLQTENKGHHQRMENLYRQIPKEFGKFSNKSALKILNFQNCLHIVAEQNQIQYHSKLCFFVPEKYFSRKVFDV
jgi:hypothetical protein